MSVLQIVLWFLVIIALAAAYISGWEIIDFLHKREIIPKKTHLRCLSWFALIEYYSIQKKENGSYGRIGWVYIFSIMMVVILSIILICSGGF